jgi:hypothetical protein
VEAALGPCIRPECYGFGARDLDRLARRLGALARAHASDGSPALDVPAAVAAALERCGARLVIDHGGCTACSTGWFSYRARGESERQATVVVGRS